jgi:broad specificity phosphatase PhoE
VNTTILLVRHGQTAWNRQDRFRGREDLPLNAHGHWQARAAGAVIADRWKPIAIYCSPLIRAVQTASAIAIACGLTVQEHLGLVDIDYGRWQGLSQADAQVAFPDAYGLWLSSPEIAMPPGGERLQEVAQRASHALHELVTCHPGQEFVAVGHTVVNRLLLCRVLGLAISSFWRLRQDTACINAIEWDGRDYTVSELNSTCHLRQLG